MSPQDAAGVKRAAGNIEWYRNTLLSAQHDECWKNDQGNPTWVEYNELRAEMDKIVGLHRPLVSSSPGPRRSGLPDPLPRGAEQDRRQASQSGGAPSCSATTTTTTNSQTLAPAQHSLGKSVFVPEHMRTHRRVGGY